MEFKYVLKSGKKVTLKMYYDALENKKYYKEADLIAIEENGKKTFKNEYIKIENDSHGNFFTIDGEKVYASDYEYLTVDELKEKISKEEFVTKDDVIATLLKDKDKFGIICRLVNKKMYFNNYNLKEATSYQVCIPAEENYSKDMWFTKIEFIPLNEEDRKLYLSEVVYLIELYNALLRKEITLINIKKLKENKELLQNDELVRTLIK